MIKIKDIPKYERPIERILNNDSSVLSNEELISILLHTGYKNYSVKELSLNLLSKINDISNLKDISKNELLKIKGIGAAKAAIILACVEISKRMLILPKENYIKISNCEDIYNNFKNLFFNKKQEHFYCIYLDVKKRVIDTKLLFIGTINYSLVNPREIFKEAYLNGATSIVCMHNHPSNDVTPSKNDISLTNHLIELGKIHNIAMDDHVIIGNNNYFSFFENNLI